MVVEAKKQQTKGQPHNDPEERPDVVLARYLASVSVEQWLQLGLPQLKKIRAALENSQAQ